MNSTSDLKRSEDRLVAALIVRRTGGNGSTQAEIMTLLKQSGLVNRLGKLWFGSEL